MSRVRVHQHVNPLAPYYRFTPPSLELAEIYAAPEQNVHLDVGCARGRFILKMAEIEPQTNFLGVEIREPLVIEANKIAAAGKIPNLHYEFCNAMIALDKLIEKIPNALLQNVTIQFPDPWFKNRHAKRRMVNDELVKMIVEKLADGGKNLRSDRHRISRRRNVYYLSRQRKSARNRS